MRKAAAYVVMTCAAALSLAAPVAADTPKRVVSMNLCTDQLAMMLADEGQLLSVSRIAFDANVSPMAEEAKAYLKNHGQAEEIFLMQPDMVLAGTYTTKASVDMLRDLGIPVEIFDITASLDGVREQIARMGKVLHRDEAAAAMIAQYDARRARLEAREGARPSAMLYYANGLTSGEGSLAHEILDLAGFRNAAVEAGFTWGMKLPLEVLTMTEPDIVITATPYPGGSRAEDVMHHPAVAALRQSSDTTAMTDHDWVCGTPFVLRAAEELAEVRRALTGAAR